ncbi:MAG: hypothetical protein R3E65_11265 [Steroidobacteraceae bacterium]
MVARVLAGIDIAEHTGPGAAITPAPAGVTAFVGRTLKGPINDPIVLHDFASFQRIFGGLWQPSTLSYAVEQFFDNGGRTAIVVRVANGARPATLSVGAAGATLTLAALSPGTREHLRAAVDHDGIGPQDDDRFNLVIQRVRGHGSELIEDQEIFRRVSVRRDASRFVGTALADSRLVRLVGDPPLLRPGVTPPERPGDMIGYVSAGTDGDDGAALTDYDLIGSAQHGTGLFALRAAPPFEFLCMPPLTREHDVGLSTLLVAGRFCRERHAMLVIDPPRDWLDADAALAGLRGWPYRADNALMYFPRLTALDRLRGRSETFAPCGAVAGMLARAAASGAPWSPVAQEEVLLRPGFRPAASIDLAARLRLAQYGVNTLSAVRLPQLAAATPRTLAAGNASATDWRYLGPRRLALHLAQSVGQGTRWMQFEQNGPEGGRRAAAQVEAFLAGLDAEGRSSSSAPGEGWFVICDERLNEPRHPGAHLLFGYCGSREGEMHSFLVTHRAGETRVRPVQANRYTTAARRVTEEIETGLLRGIGAP